MTTARFARNLPPASVSLLREISRELGAYNILESTRRLVDRKPMQCSLYVTDRCNLDCAYCTEYDNSRAHPPIEELKKWVKKIRELGTMRIALVGGEPLTHPDIVELVRYCRELGFATSLTTNGFLLTREKVKALEASRVAGDADQRRSHDAEPDHEKIFQDSFAEARLFQRLKDQSAYYRRDLRRHAAGISRCFGNGIIARHSHRSAAGARRSDAEIPRRSAVRVKKLRHSSKR